MFVATKLMSDISLDVDWCCWELDVNRACVLTGSQASAPYGLHLPRNGFSCSSVGSDTSGSINSKDTHVDRVLAYLDATALPPAPGGVTPTVRR